MLPNDYTITPTHLSKTDFLKQLLINLAAGKKLIQIRLKSLPHHLFLDYSQQAMALAKPYQATLLLNTDIETATNLKAKGVHLSSHQLMQLNERPAISPPLIAASCHNRAELQRAEKIGLDFVTLSPVCPTTSHPNATPLGWKNFSNLVAGIHLPVFALGGLIPDDLPIAIQHGAYGIAAITALWMTHNHQSRYSARKRLRDGIHCNATANFRGHIRCGTSSPPPCRQPNRDGHN